MPSLKTVGLRFPVLSLLFVCKRVLPVFLKNFISCVLRREKCGFSLRRRLAGLNRVGLTVELSSRFPRLISTSVLVSKASASRTCMPYVLQGRQSVDSCMSSSSPQVPLLLPIFSERLFRTIFSSSPGDNPPPELELGLEVGLKGPVGVSSSPHANRGRRLFIYFLVPRYTAPG